MKRLNTKIWEWFFTNVMGVEFIADSPEFLVKKPIGMFMCEHSVMLGDMVKISNGRYKFNKAVQA